MHYKVLCQLDLRWRFFDNALENKRQLKNSNFRTIFRSSSQSHTIYLESLTFSYELPNLFSKFILISIFTKNRTLCSETKQTFLSTIQKIKIYFVDFWKIFNNIFLLKANLSFFRLTQLHGAKLQSPLYPNYFDGQVVINKEISDF